MFKSKSKQNETPSRPVNKYKIRYAIDVGRKDIRSVTVVAFSLPLALAYFQNMCDEHRYDENEYTWFYTEIVSIQKTK